MTPCHLKNGEFHINLVPNRLRGEIASFDIIIPKTGEVVVEQGRRITARHIKILEKNNMKDLIVPTDYLVGKVLSKNIPKPQSEEFLAQANEEISVGLLDILAENGIASFEMIYTNDLDHGSYISDTIRLDNTHSSTEALVEIYRMMRPGEPPTKEAAEALFKNLFFSEERYDLSDVGRMKFNRRVGRKIDTGPGTLEVDDIVSVINTKSGQTGVVATDNGAGITLTASDGRNISLATATGDTLSLENLGLVAPASARANGQNPLIALTAGSLAAMCNHAGVTLVSDKSFTISGGANTTALADLAALGLQEGVYGGSNNGIKIRDLDIGSVAGSNDALGAVDAALGQISDMRSNLGAIQNRLQSAIENLTTTSNNMQQSVSRIADTDYGTATTQMSRAQIINQAATAMLAQANQQSQLVLQLLK
jgi:flagellin-like hook-associated protein FlgL